MLCFFALICRLPCLPLSCFSLPQSLIDWGVQVMECFKADVNTLSANEAAATSKPNKESTEYAIVALIRSFSAQADTFRSYLQAGADARATAGLSGLKVLSQQVRGVCIAMCWIDSSLCVRSGFAAAVYWCLRQRHAGRRMRTWCRW